jgi:hypothetical protein
MPSEIRQEDDTAGASVRVSSRIAARSQHQEQEEEEGPPPPNNAATTVPACNDVNAAVEVDQHTWWDKKCKETKLVKDFRPDMDSSLQFNFGEWSEGSTLFFCWTWPRNWRSIRDWLEVFIQGDLPDYWSRQKWSQELEQQARPLNENIRKVVQRECVQTRFVLARRMEMYESYVARKRVEWLRKK